MFLVFSYSKLFFLHFLLILSFFVFNYTFGQQQFGYSDNSFYPSINQQLPFSSFPAYGKYFYFTPYGNYGESGYEGPAFGINSYWQPGIANYPSGYGQQGGYNPSLQCLDQLTNCALQASSGKCTYSPNTLANCPMSCGVPCPSSNHLNDYYYNNGGNPLPQSSLSSGVYKDIFSHPTSSSTQRYNNNLSYNQPFQSKINPNMFPPFYCRDSHIFGCQNWAKLDFCQKIPEFMLNYCRASCGVCNNYLPFSSAFKTPITTTTNPFNSLSRYFNNEGFEGPPEPFGEENNQHLLSNNLLPYSHYYYLNTPLKMGTERKEKQQKLENKELFQQNNKILFNEDEKEQLQTSSSPIFNNNLVNIQKHSSFNKLIKMDDLLDN